MQPKINYTEMLMQEYGSDEMALGLIQEYRVDLKMTDEEIYNFLESFY